MKLLFPMILSIKMIINPNNKNCAVFLNRRMISLVMKIKKIHFYCESKFEK